MCYIAAAYSVRVSPHILLRIATNAQQVSDQVRVEQMEDLVGKKAPSGMQLKAVVDLWLKDLPPEDLTQVLKYTDKEREALKVRQHLNCQSPACVQTDKGKCT